MTGKSPEEWEAADHIETLKSGIPAVEQSENCEIKSPIASLMRAVVWIVRHIDVTEKNGKDKQQSISLGKFRMTGYGVGAILAILALVGFLAILFLMLEQRGQIRELYIRSVPHVSEYATDEGSNGEG